MSCFHLQGEILLDETYFTKISDNFSPTKPMDNTIRSTIAKLHLYVIQIVGLDTNFVRNFRSDVSLSVSITKQKII